MKNKVLFILCLWSISLQAQKTLIEPNVRWEENHAIPTLGFATKHQLGKQWGIYLTGLISESWADLTPGVFFKPTEHLLLGVHFGLETTVPHPRVGIHLEWEVSERICSELVLERGWGDERKFVYDAQVWVRLHEQHGKSLFLTPRVRDEHGFAPLSLTGEVQSRSSKWKAYIMLSPFYNWNHEHQGFIPTVFVGLKL